MVDSSRTLQTAVIATACGFLGACSSTQVTQTPVVVKQPEPLHITQFGSGKSARYAYCDATTCPAPTKKTLPDTLRVPEVTQSWKSANVAEVLAESQGSTQLIDFAFNRAELSKADAAQIATMAHNAKRVEITARSDFVGPPAGQQKIAQARAAAIRAVIASQAPDAQFFERFEIADPKRVPARMQAEQRRGTVIVFKDLSTSTK